MVFGHTCRPLWPIDLTFDTPAWLCLLYQKGNWRDFFKIEILHHFYWVKKTFLRTPPAQSFWSIRNWLWIIIGSMSSKVIKSVLLSLCLADKACCLAPHSGYRKWWSVCKALFPASLHAEKKRLGFRGGGHWEWAKHTKRDPPHTPPPPPLWLFSIHEWRHMRRFLFLALIGPPENENDMNQDGAGRQRKVMSE